jgi:Rha family phage regulatory protein
MSSPNPIVITNQDHVYTTSLLVAEKFDKLHKNVLQSIELTIEKCPDKDFNGLNFQPVNYIDAKGESRPMYNLTRDGFVMLAMGFTGSKAFLWKIAFINAFNRMEQLLSTALANAHQAEVQGLAQELAALMDALFDRHPQWQETATYLQQGKNTREIADLQGKHIRNVQKMIVRMNAAGLACRPVARLTQQAAA